MVIIFGCCDFHIKISVESSWSVRHQHRIIEAIHLSWFMAHRIEISLRRSSLYHNGPVVWKDHMVLFIWYLLSSLRYYVIKSYIIRQYETLHRSTLEITSRFLLEPIRSTEFEESAIIIDECKFVIGYCGFEFVLRLCIYHVNGRVQPYFTFLRI